MYGTLAILGAFAFAYSVAAGRLEKTPVNGPVVFLAFGVLMGPYGLDLLDLNLSGEGLRSVAEFTLALVLFTGSANADIATLRRDYVDPPSRIVRFNGNQGIGVGISTVSGGNAVVMGNAVIEPPPSLACRLPARSSRRLCR